MNDLAHFAINADDIEKSRRFYENVFGWTFTAWGPPGFYQIATSDDPGAIQGALHGRRDLAGTRATGFECTIAVDDVDQVAKDVVAQGGAVVMEKATIPTVGDLIFVRDPDGNVFGAMKYEQR